MTIPIEKWKAILETELTKKEESIDIAQDAENPNEERIAKLEEKANLIEEMINLLEEYENI